MFRLCPGFGFLPRGLTKRPAGQEFGPKPRETPNDPEHDQDAELRRSNMVKNVAAVDVDVVLQPSLAGIILEEQLQS